MSLQDLRLDFGILENKIEGINILLNTGQVLKTESMINYLNDLVTRRDLLKTKIDKEMLSYAM